VVTSYSDVVGTNVSEDTSASIFRVKIIFIMFGKYIFIHKIPRDHKASAYARTGNE